ncbi:MAG: alpha/beta hydrolase [Gammaproteobacteria bacterium]|nr:alpha/beta hydrolase [Gammaproteobacteria bacterium]NIR84212.1 alpha/beta hydrolase [Gammaproteobacteria bacterium]NIR89682.1 alpha/beta hydrolase [Gammaproteobacteria bacterium]NIU05370.1 alpha/beta hydrolase [Gammaproteobacteria bacterium]NIV52316.1 alpha/beta hydrolase [Gammaproteobacteria bacterium]
MQTEADTLPTRFIFDGAQDAPWGVVLAHGAGQPMDSPFMCTFAVGLAARAMPAVRVARFEFPYMRERRRRGAKRPPDRPSVLLQAWRKALASLRAAGFPRERLIAGGKSLGGRIASEIADDENVAGLICLGYPFHAPGKPGRLRIAHLRHIQTPTLICQGARDAFGRREEVESYELSPHVHIHWLEDGDHSFKPTRRAGHSESDNLQAALDACVEFIRSVSQGNI